MADEKYISPEEYQMSSKPAPAKKTVTVSARTIGTVVTVVVLCGLSFFGGISYQKKHHSTNATTTRVNDTARGGFGDGNSGFGGGQRGDVGQVTAVSTTSITVQSQRSGSSTTYNITSSTSVTDNGQTATISDIQTGQMVIVIPASSGSTTASRILVNPGFGGGPTRSSGSNTTQNE